MQIGIAGITGRMGRMLAEAVPAAGADLVGGVGHAGDLAGLAKRCDAIIDFTHESTVARHAEILAGTRTPWVLGTTGLTQEDEALIGDAAAAIPIFVAANFSPGINLIAALAERLAAALPATSHDVEILEMHHRQKVDAPSGTARTLGRAVAAGRGGKFEDLVELGRAGHTGARKPGSIGIASMRGGQIVGSHSVLFTGSAEQVVVTHHAFDRRIFANGAVRAAFWLEGKAPGRYGMREMLGV